MLGGDGLHARFEAALGRALDPRTCEAFLRHDQGLREILPEECSRCHLEYTHSIRALLC